ncbi:uncharacterized protein LOC111621633 isoform X2 [Centruroides sculpturatus]|uniref:uncharacterized protein LOC111621633 isoform X2 n=1 Tax=Centruroides sculpturatus TaxID=218467 RepID=UPI000C6E1153|nr:uncharacterized protein LOC111621633 isoform X2 [Centruroides sculpturatus]
MEDTSLEQTEICQMSQLGFVALTELPEIITYRVFEYLEDTELDVCRQVCTEWRDIADRIMYHKVTMIKREIPFNLVNSINCESDKVRPYTGFDHNFQYNWFYLAQKPETTSNSLHMDDESKDIRNRHLQNHDTEMHDLKITSFGTFMIGLPAVIVLEITDACNHEQLCS